jgi:hypothetical protein
MNDAEVIVHKRNYLKLCILLIIMFKITSAIGTKINRSGVPTKTNILHQETFKSVYFCKVDSCCTKPLCICNSTFMASVN